MTTTAQLRAKAAQPAVMRIEIAREQPNIELLKLLIGESTIILPRKGIYTRVFLGSTHRNVTSLVARAYNIPCEDTGLISDTMSLLNSLAEVVRPGVVIDLRYTA